MSRCKNTFASFTGTSSVQMTNDVQLLTKASSSTTSIVKGSFFLWQELTNDLWVVLTLQFDDFLLKPRIDYLPLCLEQVLLDNIIF